MCADISSEIAALARARLSKLQPQPAVKTTIGAWETGERDGLLHVKGQSHTFTQAPTRKMRLLVRKFELFGNASVDTGFGLQHEVAGIAEIVDDRIGVAGTDKLAKEVQIGLKPAMANVLAKGGPETSGYVELGHIGGNADTVETWYVETYVPQAVINEIRDRYRQGTIQEFELRLSSNLWVSVPDEGATVAESMTWYFNPRHLEATGKLEGIAWREAPPKG